MDITSFVVQGRDNALLYGDYATYHAQLSKRLLGSRKKLGIASKNRGKFQKREGITAEQIDQSIENVHLALLTSERAWAQAMRYKASHATDQKGIVGKTRQHIISRLSKAANHAKRLVNALEDEQSGAATTDILEAKAYAALISATSLFEKQAWEPSLKQYSIARVVYSALATAAKGDIFKDLLSDTIDPSIRYASYRLNTPRTVPIPIIARKAFPMSDSNLVSEINKINPDILKQSATESTQEVSEAATAPQTLTWRSREVKIEDAQIAVAWGSVQNAKLELPGKLDKLKGLDAAKVTSAYDDVLTATQDAVDATKTAIDELRGEGVGQGDPRMQSLQITRTAVHYEMISWRIGRNRVMMGPDDGATEQYQSSRRQRKTAEEVSDRNEKDLPSGKKLSNLKAKAALYDGALQNLKSITELPGVAADESLSSQLDAYVKYFEALKSLSIARSHTITNNAANALALISHSLSLVKSASSLLSKTPSPSSSPSPTSPLSADVSPEALANLEALLTGELQRHRAIVHIETLTNNSGSGAHASVAPLAERLHDYPSGSVDLKNIIQFPPKISLIPVKPIFLDIAWNYIDYPGKVTQPSGTSNKEGQEEHVPVDIKPAGKKGWFGFGRG